MAAHQYKRDDLISYTLGAFPTFELLQNRPDTVTKIWIHSSFPETEAQKLRAFAAPYQIPVTVQDKEITKISDKENCFVIGFFQKKTQTLQSNKPHILLVQPGNMGNFGTILRTALAFGFHDIAIISPAADVFHPKTVRASMGALFHLSVMYFDSCEAYQKSYPSHHLFCFMLNADKQLLVDEIERPPLFTLVFGNEATGLPEEYLHYGTSLLIPQSNEVDSLNITIAAGIACFAFSDIKTEKKER